MLQLVPVTMVAFSSDAFPSHLEATAARPSVARQPSGPPLHGQERRRAVPRPRVWGTCAPTPSSARLPILAAGSAENAIGMRLTGQQLRILPPAYG
ncbi:uncharacterized protein VTP21DRAFT_4191 [Calcarisporiella thermophila]|uniref:uncharacterized protein n=1 Tax=Calcarisporiella thermophila TaxID=911321 RepID=UPI00374400F1